MAQNSIAAHLLMIILLGGGLWTAMTMQKEIDPHFELDIVNVLVSYPGAAPEEVERGVCIRIEEEVQGIEGVKGDLDIMAAAVGGGRACVQVLFVRGARVLGSKTYYPPLKLQENPAEVLSAFISQYYLGGARSVPPEVIVSTAPEDLDTLAAAGLVERRTSAGDRRRRYVRLPRSDGHRSTGLPTMPASVLFVCTHNSARSIMAEALLREKGGDTYDAFSAGTEAAHVRPLTLRVPQLRDGSFSTEIFSRYQRSEQALVLSLMELVVNGVPRGKRRFELLERHQIRFAVVDGTLGEQSVAADVVPVAMGADDEAQRPALVGQCRGQPPGSGIGRELGEKGLEAYTESKTVTVAMDG